MTLDLVKALGGKMKGVEGDAGPSRRPGGCPKVSHDGCLVLPLALVARLAYQEGGIVLLRAHCLWHPPKEDALRQCSGNITAAVEGWCVVLITWVCAWHIFAT